MALDEFVQYLLGSEELASRIARVEVQEARDPVLDESLRARDPGLEHLLQAAGVSRLYTHQAGALQLAARGQDQVIVTGTASGKTLCYNLAVLHALLAEPEARALYLFPTKALAQDQLKTLRGLLDKLPVGSPAVAADTYDGDTPTHRRKRVRSSARVILSNPDMLHQSILPSHPRWAGFFRQLRFVVLDEIHVYRGVFGSHVANVLRRMERICAHYGARPLYICTSATIANPVQLAEELTGRHFELLATDGSPRGKRYFLFWNPPPSRRNPALRRSALAEAQLLLGLLLEREIQHLVFLRTRAQAEMLYRYMRDDLARRNDPRRDRIRAYRGGYLPSERREIEELLFTGRLLSVATTNALELGIDVGHLQASLVVGYPGSLSSLWQQAGRAGRGAGSSLAIFIASNDPEDQYLVRNPSYFLRGAVESAAIDPHNPYILANHLGCAAFELPLLPEETPRFGPLSAELGSMLEQEQYLKRIDGRWYWSSSDYPASRTNLRTLLGRNFQIACAAEEGAAPEVLGTLDEGSVQLMAHPGAIYLHEGETFRVRKLDFETRIIDVEKVDTDFYTRAIVQSTLSVRGVRESCRIGRGWAHIGEVSASWSVVAFRKLKFYTQDNLGVEPLDLPPQQMETMALWLRFESAPPGHGVTDADFLRGLQGLQHLLSFALPMLAMCDRADVGAAIQPDLEAGLALYLYDRYPGGMGFAERGYARIGDLLRLAQRMVSTCRCESGCPSCVGAGEMGFAGAAGLVPTHPDKVQTLRLLDTALGSGRS